MQSKRNLAIEKFEYWADHMTCPICHSNLAWADNQVRCSNNHSFDLAKQGYINLAPNHQEAHYNSQLFAARQRIMDQAQLYAGIYDQILDLLAQKGIAFDQADKIIDLGTGEGTHLHQLINHWHSRLDSPSQGPHPLGLDLAKDGILSAAKHYTNALWVVADLSQLPFKDGRVDGALTILSPSNYPALNKALADQGWFIKIIPGPHYLKELRAIVLDEADQRQDSSASITKFKAAFDNFGQTHFESHVPLNKEQMADLVAMTPLMWHASEEEIATAQALTAITIDLYILFGQKKT